MDGLTEVERRKVQDHLAGCKRCSSEFTELKATLRAVPQHSFHPSNVRPETYWQLFASKVDRRIREQKHEAEPSSIVEYFASLFQHRNQFAVGFVSALGLFLVVFALWRISLPGTEESTFADRELQPERATFQTASLETRTYDYLERSKVLLVGLVNVDADLLKSSRINLVRQKEISRELLRESRELSASLNGPSQLRLKRLVGDLEIIMLQIANLETEQNSPGVEIVKGGVERRGILLKINLAEIERGERTSTNSPRRF